MGKYGGLSYQGLPLAVLVDLRNLSSYIVMCMKQQCHQSIWLVFQDISSALPPNYLPFRSDQSLWRLYLEYLFSIYSPGWWQFGDTQKSLITHGFKYFLLLIRHYNDVVTLFVRVFPISPQHHHLYLTMLTNAETMMCRFVVWKISS